MSVTVQFSDSNFVLLGNVGLGTTDPAQRLVVAGDVVPGGDNTGSLGSAALRWRDMYLSGNTIRIGTTALSTANGDLIVAGDGGADRALVVGQVDCPELSTSNLGVLQPDVALGAFPSHVNATVANRYAFEPAVVIEASASPSNVLDVAAALVVASDGRVRTLGAASGGAATLAAESLCVAADDWFAGCNVAAFGAGTVLVQSRLGVGTTQPQHAVDVAGDVRATTFVGDGSLVTGIESPWSATAGGSLYYIGGNVGVGTTSPQTALHVVGTAKASSFEGSGASLSNLAASNVTGTLSAGVLPPALGVAATTAVVTVAANGNVGVGTTQPSADLEVVGTATAAAFLAADGSALTGLSATQLGAGTGTFPNTALPAALAAATSVATVCVTTGGNVGAGTTVANAALAVHGAMAVGAAFANATLGAGCDLAVASKLGVGVTNPTASVAVRGKMAVGATYAAEAPPVSGALVEGSVGIGTTSPTHALHVAGNAKVTTLEVNGTFDATLATLSCPDIRISGSGFVSTSNFVTIASNMSVSNVTGRGPALSVTQKTVGGNGAIAEFYDAAVSASVPVFKIGDNGNVGVGTTAAAAALAVCGNMSVGAPYASYAPPASGLLVSGNIGIGTTVASCNVTVIGTLRATQFVGDGSKLSGVSGSGGGGGSDGWTTYNTSNLAASGYVGIGGTPKAILDLYGDGARQLSTVTWTVGSDARLKTDIATADYDACYQNMRALDLKRFKYRDDLPWPVAARDQHKLGWIAQDVQTVFPKAVTVTPSQYGLSDVLHVTHDQLYAMMYGAIRRLQDKVEALRAALARP